MTATERARIKAKSDRAWQNECRLLASGGSDRRRKYWANVSKRLDGKKWRPLRRNVMRWRKEVCRS